MYKFWNFIIDEADGRVLRLEGPIDDEAFWGDEVTPDAFREELEAEDGDVTVWINSPGGNVFAAAEIYSMLREHKGKITVKIGSLAASAASVIAMAGDKVLMSPVAMLMVHDPQTIAIGSEADLQRAIDSLKGVKESIINAYEAKTGLDRTEIADLMAKESWIDAKEAVEKGFADKVLYVKGSRSKGKEPEEIEEEIKASIKEEYRRYYEGHTGKALFSRIPCADESAAKAEDELCKDPGAQEDVEQPKKGIEPVSLQGEPAKIPAEPQEEPAKLPLSNQPVACGVPVISQVEPDEVAPTNHAPKKAEIAQHLGVNEADLGDDAENEGDFKLDQAADGVPVSSQVETAEVADSNLVEPHEIPVSSDLKADGADQVGKPRDKAPKTGESGEDAGNSEAHIEPDAEPIGSHSETAEVPVETQTAPHEEPVSMPPKVDASDPPTIGLDGKTEDGAMPYELLKNQLEFLK